MADNFLFLSVGFLNQCGMFELITGDRDIDIDAEFLNGGFAGSLTIGSSYLHKRAPPDLIAKRIGKLRTERPAVGTILFLKLVLAVNLAAALLRHNAAGCKGESKVNRILQFFLVEWPNRETKSGAFRKISGHGHV